MNKQCIALLLSVPLLFACAGPEPKIQMGDDAEVIMDRLHRMDNTRVGIAFVDPDADFSRFSNIMLDPQFVNPDDEIFQAPPCYCIAAHVAVHLNHGAP